MTIKFKSEEFKGTHGAVVVPPPELQSVRTFFWGLNGQTEIVGGLGGRVLTIDAWVHGDFKRRIMCESYINTINNTHIGTNGKLTVTYESSPKRGGKKKSDSWKTTYEKSVEDFNAVTFMGFFPEGVGSQTAVPLYDYAGTVDGGWFIAGTFQFYDLSSK